MNKCKQSSYVMHNTVCYNESLVAANFSGYHQTCIQEQMKEIIHIMHSPGRKRFVKHATRSIYILLEIIILILNLANNF